MYYCAVEVFGKQNVATSSEYKKLEVAVVFVKSDEVEQFLVGAVFEEGLAFGFYAESVEFL
jgi:hypothetical protein